MKVWDSRAGLACCYHLPQHSTHIERNWKSHKNITERKMVCLL